MCKWRNGAMRQNGEGQTHDISKVEVGGAQKKHMRRSVENIGINQSSNYN